jgi:hypothetical protein
MGKLIAYCGLTCTECPAYIATQSDDADAMGRVAEQWSTHYNTQLTAEDCWCNGCLNEKGPWMSHCAECAIRACGVEKGVENCAHCDDYGCDKLTEFFGLVPDAKEALDGIRRTL